jgi:hypothetical protein
LLFCFRLREIPKYTPAIYVVLGNLQRRYWNEVRGSQTTLTVATIGLGNFLQAGRRFQDTLYRSQSMKHKYIMTGSAPISPENKDSEKITK